MLGYATKWFEANGVRTSVMGPAFLKQWRSRRLQRIKPHYVFEQSEEASKQRDWCEVVGLARYDVDTIGLKSIFIGKALTGLW